MSALQARAEQSPWGEDTGREGGFPALAAPRWPPPLPPALPALHCGLRRLGKSPRWSWRARSALVIAAFPATEFRFTGKKGEGAQSRFLCSLLLENPGVSPAREVPGGPEGALGALTSVSAPRDGQRAELPELIRP